jgi:hypothetical protein
LDEPRAIHNFALNLDDHVANFANQRQVETAQSSTTRFAASRRAAASWRAEVPTRTDPSRRLDEYLDDDSHRRLRRAAGRPHRLRALRARLRRTLDLNSFSIAKSIMSTLVGIAVAEGRISSASTQRSPTTGPTSRHCVRPRPAAHCSR